MSEIIERWMSAVVERLDFERYPDLHIDEVDPGFRERSAWANGSIAVLRKARELRDCHGWNVTMAIGVSLISGKSSIGFRGANALEEIFEAADWSPPSLYLFEPGREPWREDASCHASVQTHDAKHGCVIHCCEWFHAGDKEYRRACWISFPS